MSDMMGGAGGSGNIRVDVILAARNATTVSRQLARLKTDLASIAKANKTLAGGMGASGGSALRNERMEAQRLGVALRRAAQEAKSYGRAASIGVSTAGKRRQQVKQEIKQFQNLQKAAGTAIVGNPQNFALLRKNFRTLAADSKNANLAGIASLATMRTMQDGIARAGGRGFTAFERFRVQTFALRKDFSAVGTGMMNLGKQTSWLGRTMMLNLTLPLTAFAASASREFLKVQSQFFQLQKVMEFKTKEGVSVDPVTNLPNAAQMRNAFAPLRKEIRALSEELGASQAVITGVFRDVAALGFDSDELIMGWSRGIAQIATIGDIDFSTATEFFRSSNALFAEGDNQLQKLEKTNELMAQFNAISDETSLQLKDLADAFPEVAPVMQNFGFQAAEIGSALAGMFKLGIPSSEAAHALKFGFQRTVGFKNTRERIDSLGVSFFDEQGMAQLGQGRKAIFELASALDSLGNEERQKAIGEITGARQTARWGIYFRSVIEGERQLQQALKDRKLTAEELREIDSDYMRGLLASGEIKRQFEEAVRTGAMSKEDMPDLSILDDPVERYKMAMEAYKEDPATKWNIMITTIKNALIDVGEFIVPIITTWGTSLGKFFQKLANMPDILKKISGGMAVLAAAVGGVIVAFGAMTTLAGSGLKTLSALIPRLGVRNVMPDKAMSMLRDSPGRQDIGRVGNRYVHFKRGGVGAKHTPVTGLSEMQRLSGITKGADGNMSNLNATVARGNKQLSAYAATGVAGSRGVERGMANVRIANENAQRSVRNLDEANRAFFNAHNKRSQNARKIHKNQFFGGPPMSQAERRAADNAMIAPLALNRRRAQQEAAAVAEVSSKQQQKAAEKMAKQQAKQAQRLRRSAMFTAGATGAAITNPFKLARIGLKSQDLALPAAAATTSLGKLMQALRKFLGFFNPFKAATNGARASSVALAEGFSRGRMAVRDGSAELAKHTRLLKEKKAAAASTLVSSRKTAKAAETAPMVTPVPAAKSAAKNAGATAAKDARKFGRASRAVFFAALLKPISLVKIGIKGIGAAFAASVPVMLAAGAKFILIITAVIAVLGTLAVLGYAVYKTIAGNWDKIKERIKGPLDTMREAIQRLKDSFGKLFEAMKEAFKNTLFKENNNLEESGNDVEKQTDAWKTAADIIGALAEAVAVAVNFIAAAIETLEPVFRHIATIIATFIGIIANILTGNWPAVLAYFVKALYMLLRPILWIGEKIIDVFVWVVERVLWLFKQLGKGIGWVVDKITSALPGISGTNIADSVESVFQSIQNATSKFRDFDLVGGLGRRIDGWLDQHKFKINFSFKFPKVDKPPAKDAGKETGEVFNEGLGDTAGKGVGDKIAKNIKDDVEKNIEKEILKSFLDVLKSRVRKEIDEIREELEKAFAENKEEKLKAFEKKQEKNLKAFEKNKEKKLKAYDDKIDAISKLEKADEKRYRTEEYLERRRELLDRKTSNLANYRRNRALAVYENRIYDVRSLDLDYEQNVRDSNKQLLSLERDRARELLAEQREFEKERLRERQEAEGKLLEAAAEAFGKQQEAAAEAFRKKLETSEEAFKKQLGLIVEYEPRTVAEFNKMISNMQKLANKFGIDWPKTIKTGGAYYLKALKDANNQIVKEFGWGGERGIMAWVTPFISSAARSILMEKAFDMGRDVGENYQRGMDAGVGGLPSGDGGLPSSGGSPSGDEGDAGRVGGQGFGIPGWPRPLVTPPAVDGFGIPGWPRPLLAPPRTGDEWRAAGEAAGLGFIGGLDSIAPYVAFPFLGVISQVKRIFGIRSPSTVFMNIGKNVVRGLASGMASAAVSLPGRIIQALSSLPGLLSRWLSTSFRNLITGFPGFVGGLVARFSGMPARLISAAAGLPGGLINWATGGFTNLRTNLPNIISGVASWFRDLPGFLVDKIGSIARRLFNWATESFTSFRKNLPNVITSVTNWFRDLPGFLVSKVGSIAGKLFTWATDSFVRFSQDLDRAANSLFQWFKNLPGNLLDGMRNFVNDKIANNPIARAGWNLVKGIFGFHTGGIVGEKNNPAKLTGRPNEVLSVLLKGEGVLPVSAMSKIGPQGFEMLRQGALGGAVAMMASGSVSARAPRLASMPAFSPPSKESSGGSGGDVYIHVDTFIGQEQWFKSMADKYDMKVASRQGINSGSAKRTLSSYNVNNRNSFR